MSTTTLEKEKPQGASGGAHVHAVNKAELARRERTWSLRLFTRPAAPAKRGRVNTLALAPRGAEKKATTYYDRKHSK